MSEPTCKKPLLVILGPTASGKSALGLAAARRWGGEIVNCDSMQLIRGMEVGTAKPSAEERRRVPHHLFDRIDPDEFYNAGRYMREARQVCRDIAARGQLPVVVGGTGLYVRALAEGLFREPPMEPARRRALDDWLRTLDDPALIRWVTRLDPGFRGGGRQRALRALELALLTGRPLGYWQRIARARGVLDPWYVRLTAPRPVLHRRIRHRAEEMVRRGMIEEVAAVLADGAPPTGPGLDAVGVREAVDYLQGRRDRASVAEAITISTRQYAKRQETWFRHQLPGPVLTLDATRPADEVAAEIVAAWEAAGAAGTTPARARSAAG